MYLRIRTPLVAVGLPKVNRKRRAKFLGLEE